MEIVAKKSAGLLSPQALEFIRGWLTYDDPNYTSIAELQTYDTAEKMIAPALKEKAKKLFEAVKNMELVTNVINLVTDVSKLGLDLVSIDVRLIDAVTSLISGATNQPTVDDRDNLNEIVDSLDQERLKGRIDIAEDTLKNVKTALDQTSEAARSAGFEALWDTSKMHQFLRYTFGRLS